MIERLDTGTDLAPSSPTASAPISSANPDTTVYFDTGFWHADVAQVLVDRGVEPGKVLMGGFDLVPEVLQQMEAGYIQVQVDQQPYMQGFMPVMEVYLCQDRRSGAGRHRHRQGHRAHGRRADAIMELPAQGHVAEAARQPSLRGHAVRQ